ncbi:unnamed protein product [Alternaria alternata]
MDGRQRDGRQSQYFQYAGGDGNSPYPGMYNNNNQEPIEAASTSSGWDQERPTSAPNYSEPKEQTGTNTGFINHNQDGLQPMRQPCIGYIPQSQLSWVEHNQHRSATSNIVETEPDWDWTGKTDYAGDPIASAEYGVSHPYPCSLPLNQPAAEFNFQDPYDLSGLSLPAFAAQASEHPDTNNLGSLMNEIVRIETSAGQEPWSVFESNQSFQVSPQDYSYLGTYRNGAPNTTNPSTFDYGDSESSYPTADDSWTHISSNYPNNDAMNDSMLTERAEALEFQTPPAILPSSSSSAQMPLRPRFRVRGATPPVGRQDNATYTSIRETG